jgi:4-amino-4-deoxy-L-arabinose transferase-like glycosyltransferase
MATQSFFLFLLALAVRLGLSAVLGTYWRSEGSEVVNVAWALAHKGQFADAYGVNTGPTAHTAPLYPLLLSLVFRFAPNGQIGQMILSSVFSSITCALLPYAAAAFGMGRRVGLWTALWAALLPVNCWPQTKGTFESALVGLCTVLICLYFARLWTAARFSAPDAVWGGLLAGISCLVSPSVLPVVAALLLLGVWLFRSRTGSYLKYAGLFVLVGVLVLSPWAIRNKLVLGSAIFTRSNLPLELHMSYNDWAQPDYYANEVNGMFERFHPFLNQAARTYVTQHGEVAFERKCRDEVKAWIRAHPGRFAELTGERFALFWFPRMKRPVQSIFLGVETLFGLAGYVLLLRTKLWAKWIVGAMWVAYPPVYYFVQAFPRYRYPIDWSFELLGFFAISMALSRWRREKQEHELRGDTIIA